MSIAQCIKKKNKLNNAEDKADFERYYNELLASNVPAEDAFTQAAEQMLEQILQERNELAVEVRKQGGYLQDVTIEQLLEPVKNESILNINDDNRGDNDVSARNRDDQADNTQRNARRKAKADGQQDGSNAGRVQRSNVGGSINSDQQATGGDKRNGLSRRGTSDGDNRKGDKGDNAAPVSKRDQSEVPANYRITGDEGIAQGGSIQRARQNIAAIRIAKNLIAENRYPTTDEQRALSLYVGFGDTSIKNKIFPADESSLTGTWAALNAELLQLLTKDELDTVKRSGQYAHYTPLDVIDQIYAGLKRLGVKSGAAFEGGVGSGNFIGRVPEYMDIRFTGVEMDGVTSAIASGLYPQAAIFNKDFQKLPLPHNYYDLIIGNPPFADITVKGDKRYRKYKFLLHDYFLAKQMDALKPGGIMAVVVSKGTLDKHDSKLREYLAARADLLAAIRLPKTAFKENAGTDVVTDVLFFQKREAGVEPNGIDFIESLPMTVDGETFNVNEYYHNNPHMVLGKPSAKGSMYGSNEYTVESKGKLVPQLKKAMRELPAKLVKENPTAAELDEKAIQFELATGHKEGAYYLSDGGLRQTIGGVGVMVQLRAKGVPGMTKKNYAVVTDYINLRDELRKTFDAMLHEGDWQKAQIGLNAAYDDFVKKHGPINFTREFTDKAGRELTRRPILDAISLDPDAYRVAAIETFDITTGKATKRAIFTDNIVAQKKEAQIEAAEDVLKLSLNERGMVDLDWMAEQYQQSKEDVIEELGDAIYYDPSLKQWVTADQYLSGDVKLKLFDAQILAEDDPSLVRNVAALKEVIPKDKLPSEVKARLGVHWIPADIIQQFAQEVLGFEGKVTSFVKGNKSSWNVDGKTDNQDYATADRDAVKILSAALNKKQIVIRRKVPNGNGGWTEETDKEATAAAGQKVQELTQKFSEWVPTNEDASNRLTAIYNQKFNSIQPRKFDGSHLAFPRLSNKYKLRQWQKDVVWRILQRGNTYMAHTVGAGKTLASIVAGMEMRRLGIAKKPAYVVLKSTLNQFAAEFYDAYPDANLLVADEQRMSRKHRRQFLAQMAMGDWDAVIFTHENFKEINMSQQYVADYIDKELDEYRALLEDVDEQDRITRRQIENKIEKLENELEGAANAKFHELEDFDFEELGIDFLFVDEAHHHKKIPIITEQGNIKGVPTDGSQRARDLFMKTQYLNTLKPGKHTVLMSGTPITNTMAELYNIQRYLQPEALEAGDVGSFDSWSSMFADLVTDIEMQPNGKFKPVTRMKSFSNVSALMRDFLQVADIVNDAKLNESTEIERPAVRGGSRELVVVPSAPEMKSYQEELGSRITKLEQKKGPPKKGDDNILVVIMDGKKSAIDLRLVGREQSTPSKLDKMIDNVFEEWKRGKNDVYYDEVGKAESLKGSTQLIFTELRKTDYFDIYDHIKNTLIERGVPENEIAFIQDYNNSRKKAKLFRDFNSGKIRVLIGGSQNLGTGTNVQVRGTMLHHLDLDYLPANIIQREGRYIRSGNKNKEVSIKAYATEGTIDATMWQINESKQRMVDQAMSGELSVDNIDDVSDTVNQMAMAKALSSGNPLVLEQAGLDSEVQKLEALRSAFYDQQFKNRQISAGLVKRLKKAESDQLFLEDLKKRFIATVGKAFKGKLGARNYTDRKAMGADLILEVKKALANQKGQEPKKVGELAGYDVYVSSTQFGLATIHLDRFDSILNPVDGFPWLDSVVGASITVTDIEDGVIKPLGIISRLENQAKSYVKAPKQLTQSVKKAEKKLKSFQGDGGDFQYESDLREKQKRLEEVNKLLSENEDNNKSDDGNGAGGEPKFSLRRGADNDQSISINKIQSIVDEIVPDAQDVHVVADFASLPDAVQQEAFKQGSDGNDIQGAIHQGKIYLNAAKLLSREDVEKVLWHELGHKGLKTLLADRSVSRAMSKLMLAIGGRERFNALADQLGVDLSAYDEGVSQTDAQGKPIYSKQQREQIVLEELLAHIAERGSKGLKQKALDLLGAIRHWLRQHGWLKLAELGASDLSYLAKRAREAGVNAQAADDIRLMFDQLNAQVNDGIVDLGNGQGFNAHFSRIDDGFNFRVARDFQQAREAAQQFVNKPLRSEDGFQVTVSNNNLRKMLSHSAVGQSESIAEHVMAVANLDYLFEHSQLGWSKTDRNDLSDIKAIHRFFTSMVINGKERLVKLTVKEFAQANQGSKLYSVESISVEDSSNPVPEMVDADITQGSRLLTGPTGYVKSLVQAIQKSNTAEDVLNAAPQSDEWVEELKKLAELEEPIILEGDAIQDGIDYEAEKSLFLSSLPERTIYRAASTRTAKAIKLASNLATKELRGNGSGAGMVSRATRKRGIRGTLGLLENISSDAKVYSFDDYESLVVRYYSETLTEHRVNDSPILTIVVEKDGELTIHGPAVSSQAFKWLEAQGMASVAIDATGASAQGGIDLQGFTRLEDVTRKQLIQVLGDAHARTKLWRGRKKVGLKWKRATGAKGGMEQQGSAVFFSRQSGGVSNTSSSIKKQFNRAWDAVSKGKAGNFVKRNLWGLLKPRQIAEQLKHILPTIESDYLEDINRMEAVKNYYKHQAGEIADRRRKSLSEAQNDQLSNMQHEATIAGVDPDVPYVPIIDVEEAQKRISVLYEQMLSRPGGKKAKFMQEIKDIEMQKAQEKNRLKVKDEIQALWSELNDEQKAIYRLERDFHVAMREAQQQALLDRIRESEVDEAVRKKLMDSLEQQFGFDQVTEPYFPLSRFGEYWVHASTSEGITYDMFETEGEWEAFKASVVAEGGKVLGAGKKPNDFNVKDGALNAEFVSNVDELIAALGDDPQVEALRDSVYQLYLQSLPALSARKHQIRRKKTSGFYQDHLRAFASTATHGANLLGRLTYEHKLKRTLDDAKKAVEMASHEQLYEAVAAEVLAYRSYIQDALKLSDAEIREKIGAFKGAANEEDRERWKKYLEFRKQVGSTGSVKLDKDEEHAAVLKRIKDREALLDIADKIKQQEKQVYAADALAELEASHDYAMNPMTAAWANIANALGFVWFLGATPAAALVNMTQTPVVALPVIGARFGFNNVAKEMKQATKDFFKSGKLSKEFLKTGQFSIEPSLRNANEREAYSWFHDTGLLTKTLVQDLQGMGDEGINTGELKHKILGATAYMFQRAEVANREITAIAAYRAGINKGLTHEKAMQEAARLTWKTHFDYGSHNRARFMRGDVARVVTQFKQYSQEVFYLYTSTFKQALKASGATPEERLEAKKALTAMYVAQFAVAGSLGLFGATAIMAIAESLTGWDDDEPEEAKAKYRKWLADMLGNTGGRIMAKGLIDGLTPISMHGRLTLGDLWIRTSDRELEGSQKQLELFKAVLGPQASIATGFMTGFELIGKGYIERGLEQMMPKVLKDAVKATRYSIEDAKSLRGMDIKEMSPAEILFKAMGFASSDLSDLYDQNNAIRNIEKRLQDRRSLLIDQMIQAKEKNDRNEIRRLNREILRFSMKNPAYKINARVLSRSGRSRDRYRQQMQNGIRQTKRNRDIIQQYDFAQ